MSSWFSSGLNHVSSEQKEPPVVLVCDVGALRDPDMASVDAIARLQLSARRSGCELRLENACAQLVQLLDLAGLSDVIPIATD